MLACRIKARAPRRSSACVRYRTERQKHAWLTNTQWIARESDPAILMHVLRTSRHAQQNSHEDNRCSIDSRISHQRCVCTVAGAGAPLAPSKRRSRRLRWTLIEQ